MKPKSYVTHMHTCTKVEVNGVWIGDTYKLRHGSAQTVDKCQYVIAKGSCVRLCKCTRT